MIACGLDEALYRTLSTTNPIENLNGLIARFTANVTRWRDGQMLLRWIGAALTDASGRFRAVRSYCDMKRLVNALVKRAEGTSAIDHKAAEHVQPEPLLPARSTAFGTSPDASSR